MDLRKRSDPPSMSTAWRKAFHGNCREKGRRWALPGSGRVGPVDSASNRFRLRWERRTRNPSMATARRPISGESSKATKAGCAATSPFSASVWAAHRAKTVSGPLRSGTRDCKARVVAEPASRRASCPKAQTACRRDNKVPSFAVRTSGSRTAVPRRASSHWDSSRIRRSAWASNATTSPSGRSAKPSDRSRRT